MASGHTICPFRCIPKIKQDPSPQNPEVHKQITLLLSLACPSRSEETLLVSLLLLSLSRILVRVHMVIRGAIGLVRTKPKDDVLHKGLRQYVSVFWFYHVYIL